MIQPNDSTNIEAAPKKPISLELCLVVLLLACLVVGLSPIIYVIGLFGLSEIGLATIPSSADGGAAIGYLLFFTVPAAIFIFLIGVIIIVIIGIRRVT